MSSRTDRFVDASQDLGDRVIPFERMTEWPIGVDVVPVSSPDSLANEEAGLFQLVQNPLYRPLGDSDQSADVSLTQFRIAADRDQHVGVVGQEGPT